MAEHRVVASFVGGWTTGYMAGFLTARHGSGAGSPLARFGGAPLAQSTPSTWWAPLTRSFWSERLERVAAFFRPKPKFEYPPVRKYLNLDTHATKISAFLYDKGPLATPTQMQYVLSTGIDEAKRCAATTIMLAPEGAGKTTCALLAANRLRQQGLIRGAVHVDFRECPGNPERWFYHSCDVIPEGINGRVSYHAETPDQVRDILHGHGFLPVLFILDHLDDVPEAELLPFLEKITFESANNGDINRQFMFLGLFSENVDLARKAVNLNNASRQKFMPITHDGAMITEHTGTERTHFTRDGYKWELVDCAEVEACFIKKNPNPLKNEFRFEKWCERNGAQTFCDLVTRAGTPGFLRDFFEAPEFPTLEEMEAKAAALEAQWLRFHHYCAESQGASKN